MESRNKQLAQARRKINMWWICLFFMVVTLLCSNIGETWDTVKVTEDVRGSYMVKENRQMNTYDYENGDPIPQNMYYVQRIVGERDNPPVTNKLKDNLGAFLIYTPINTEYDLERIPEIEKEDHVDTVIDQFGNWSYNDHSVSDAACLALVGALFSVVGIVGGHMDVNDLKNDSSNYKELNIVEHVDQKALKQEETKENKINEVKKETKESEPKNPNTSVKKNPNKKKKHKKKHKKH